MDYINRLDEFNMQEVAKIAMDNSLYEVALAVFKKCNDNVSAVNILTNHIKDLYRANDIAEQCNDPSVWFLLAEAQFQNGWIKLSMVNYIKSNCQDIKVHKNVVETAKQANLYDELVSYLEMARNTLNVTDKKYIEHELMLIYIKIERHNDAIKCAVETQEEETAKELLSALLNLQKYQFISICLDEVSLHFTII